MIRHMASLDQERVAEFLRDRRGELELTQQQLAERAGVDTGTVSNLERAERWPQPRSRANIERALGWQSGPLQAIAKGRTPVLIDQPPGGRPRYLDAAEQHIADTPGLTPDEAEALVAVMRIMRSASVRRPAPDISPR
jgi:transcriptional regulator with XRE-family HTH domain